MLLAQLPAILVAFLFIFLVTSYFACRLISLIEEFFLDCLLAFLRVNDRYSDSYIGRDDFHFFTEILEFVQDQIYFFPV